MGREPFVTVALNGLRIEARSRELIGITVVFAVLIPVAFRIAFEAGAAEAAPVPVLCVTLLIITMVGGGRSFHGEADRGTFDALLASPAGAADLFLGKIIAASLIALVSGAFAMASTAVLVGPFSLARPDLFLALFAMGCAGLAMASTLVSALTVRSRARAALLPVVALPLAFPLLLYLVPGLEATAAPQRHERALSEGFAAAGVYLFVLSILGAVLSRWALEE